MYRPIQVKVWGDFACFTRPEMKVERVSYDVMTPSAARGVLEAIYWKPEFQWKVMAIHVLNPIRYFSILRNEVNSRAVYRTIRQRLQEGSGYFANYDRAQRHTLCLRNVAYIIEANVVVQPGLNEDPAKFRDQFQRRVDRGQCYIAPYLGCREFVAHFSKTKGDERALPINVDLGIMLFDLKYEAKNIERGQPYFFNARLRDGVLEVPPQLHREVRGNAFTTLA